MLRDCREAPRNPECTQSVTSSKEECKVKRKRVGVDVRLSARRLSLVYVFGPRHRHPWSRQNHVGEIVARMGMSNGRPSITACFVTP